MAVAKLRWRVAEWTKGRESEEAFVKSREKEKRRVASDGQSSKRLRRDPNLVEHVKQRRERKSTFLLPLFSLPRSYTEKMLVGWQQPRLNNY